MPQRSDGEVSFTLKQANVKAKKKAVRGGFKGIFYL